MIRLTEDNFLIFAAKHYGRCGKMTMDEFTEDLARFSCIKKSLNKFKKSGIINEKVVLNHIIISYNVFGEAATIMLFHKLRDHWPELIPFISILNRLPDSITHIEDAPVKTSSIVPNYIILDKLRKI